jgi:hypothetical protein
VISQTLPVVSWAVICIPPYSGALQES